MGGAHLGTFIIGDVALDHVARQTALVIVVLHKSFDLVILAGQLLKALFLFLINFAIRSSQIHPAVLGYYRLDGGLKLAQLLFEFLLRAAPLFGCVRRHLHPVDGKHILTDQTFLIANKQNVTEDRDDLIFTATDEIGDGGEVRSVIAAQRHKNDIVLTKRGDLAAADDTAGIGE